MERKARRNRRAAAVDAIELNGETQTSKTENGEEEEFVQYGAVDEFYDLKDEIGSGAYATVKKCIQKETGKVYAVKTIKATNHNIRKDVKREIELMRKLVGHSKLVQLHEAYQTPFEIAMVLEYIPGGELFERIVKEEYLMEEIAIYYVRQVLEALQYMHSRDIVHLDLKPENIMCVDKHTHDIKLVDFGLARQLSGEETVKSSFGTPDFVAPEVIRMRPVTAASDMWSVGVVTYVLLSGLMPFSGDDDHHTLVKVARAEWDWDDECFDDLTEDAKEFIEGLLQKEPSDRYTVEECLEHSWIKEKRPNQAKINTKKHRTFMAKRRWKKSVNALVAVRRMSLSPMAGRSARRSSAEPSSLASTAAKGREQPPKRKTSHGESNAQEYRQGSRYQTCIGLDMSTVRLLKEQLEKGKEKEEGKEITLTRIPDHPESIVEADEPVSGKTGSHYVHNSSANGLDQRTSTDETDCLPDEQRTEGIDHEEVKHASEVANGSDDRLNKPAEDEAESCIDINGNTTTDDIVAAKTTENIEAIPKPELTPSNFEDSVLETVEEKTFQDITNVAQEAKLYDKTVLSVGVVKKHPNNVMHPCSVTVNIGRFFTFSDCKDEKHLLLNFADNQTVLPSINVDPSSQEKPPCGSERGIESLLKAELLPGTESGELSRKTTIAEHVQKTITVKLDQCSSLNVHVKQVSSHVRRASTGSPAIEFAVPVAEKSRDL